MPIHLLSAGAAKGIVSRVFPDPAAVAGRFGSAIVTRDAVLADGPCDVVILPAALMGALREQGVVLAGSERPVGTVETALAVPQGARTPAVGDGDQLRAVLEAAEALYLPDLQRSTAGSHVAAVLDALGIASRVAGKIRSFPSGEAAMAAMAAAGQPGAVGCTQATEIVATPGLMLAGALPEEHALATTYVAAVTARAADPEDAGRFVEALTGPASAGLRREAGFS